MKNQYLELVSMLLQPISKKIQIMKTSIEPTTPGRGDRIGSLLPYFSLSGVTGFVG